jgi:aerobic carbon-monoxide dehydrogenase medium subunit
MATASLDVTEEAEILRPASEDEAVEAFGDGTNVVVVGGGTIVVPEMTFRRLRPARALLLKDAGLAGVTRDGRRISIGAMTPIEELVGMPAPLGPCAANIADLEIRAAASVGGNLCAGEGYEAPRGDLQGAFLALAATARSAGDGGITEEPLEDFLPKRRERLVLSVSFEEPAAGAFAGLDRPHTHDYTALAVSGARAADGTVRLAATGAGWWGVRLPSAEAAAADPDKAGEAALGDVTPHDDALASAWYRTKVLPVLVRRVLSQLEEAA